MSRNYKFHNPKGVYFVSFAVVGWVDVFSRKIYSDIFIDAIRFRQEHDGMEVFSWCIMSNHVHLIFRSNSDKPPQEILGRLKQYTSNQIVQKIQNNPGESRREWMLKLFAAAARNSSNVKHYQFWRHDNKPIEIWSPKVFQQKATYIHMNPVKAGLVQNPEDYVYSSGKDYAGEKGLLELTVVK